MLQFLNHILIKQNGTTDNDYFEQMRFAFDVYSSYDKFLLAGDSRKRAEHTEFFGRISCKKFGERRYMFQKYK